MDNKILYIIDIFPYKANVCNNKIEKIVSKLGGKRNKASNSNNK